MAAGTEYLEPTSTRSIVLSLVAFVGLAVAAISWVHAQGGLAAMVNGMSRSAVTDLEAAAGVSYSRRP